jgi:hypothetical protein
MTRKVRPSVVCIVSGVWTLSTTLMGDDEYNISDRSSRERSEGIHHDFASSARTNSVSSPMMTKSRRFGWSGNS